MKNNQLYLFRMSRKLLLCLTRSLVFFNLIWYTWYPPVIFLFLQKKKGKAHICESLVEQICSYHDPFKRQWLDFFSSIFSINDFIFLCTFEPFILWNWNCILFVPNLNVSLCFIKRYKSKLRVDALIHYKISFVSLFQKK